MEAKKFLIGGGMIAALAGGGIMMTAFMGGAKEYNTDTAKYTGVSEEVEATGEVHGEESRTYCAAVTAPVSYYELKVGDAVTKGQKVVGYDAEDLLTALSQAQLSAKSAENTMNGQVQASNNNQAKYNKAASDIEVYRNTYALFRQANDYIDQGQYQENWDVNCIAQGLNKQIAEKTAEVNTKTLELQKAQAEFDIDTADELMEDIEKLNKKIGDLNYDLAALPPSNLPPEEYAQTVLNGNWMSDIMRNWTETSTLKNTYENQILNKYQKEQLRNSYDLSELSVVTAEDNLRKADSGVTIDYDGIVTESFIKAGTVVAKGTPLFTVEDSNNIKVDVGISKYDIGKIEPGQRAEIRIAGNTYSGSVTRILRIAQANKSDKAKVTVYVKFDEPDEHVYLGLEADVTIYTEEKEKVLTISSEACYTDDFGDYCYLIEDGVVKKQYITTGVRSDETVEVVNGLREGSVVITDAVTDDRVGEKAQARPE
ncbi:MAG: HlyD family efflux transporter periplasmic adaptor subunit [Lachnospiraceae bacterium]|nr:HlyD family efflux transporter periplasmic adaptor subunit [Lachnospiraceae bacterium]